MAEFKIVTEQDLGKTGDPRPPPPSPPHPATTPPKSNVEL